VSFALSLKSYRFQYCDCLLTNPWAWDPRVYPSTKGSRRDSSKITLVLSRTYQLDQNSITWASTPNKETAMYASSLVTKAPTNDCSDQRDEGVWRVFLHVSVDSRLGTGLGLDGVSCQSRKCLNPTDTTDKYHEIQYHSTMTKAELVAAAAAGNHDVATNLWSKRC
jgi:hypothetical protein